MKLKQNWYRSNDDSKKMSCYIFIGLNYFWWAGDKNLVGRGDVQQIFGWWGRGLTLSPSRENSLSLYIYYTYILYIYIYIYIYYKYTCIKELCQQVFTCSEEAPSTSHTSCAKVAILLLQDENLSTLCVTDVYGICFHLSAQCSYYNKFITS